MYRITNRDYVSIEKDDNTTEIAGIISDEKLGKLNLILKTNPKGEVILNKKKETIPIGLAEVKQNKTACYFMKNGKAEKTYHWDCRYEKPVADLSEQEIKLYSNKYVFRRALKQLGKTSLGPVLASIDCLGKKRITKSEFEKTINKLKDEPENQYIFILARDKLIESGIMPVNEKGQPHDLSLMYIPVFDVNTFGIKMIGRDPDFFKELWDFYEHTKTEETKDRPEDFVKSVNLMKIENPAKFVKAYQILVEEKMIPESHSTPEVNLTPEQFDYLKNIYTITLEQDYEDKHLGAAMDYINRQMNKHRTKQGRPADFDIIEQSPKWIEKHISLINRLIPQMRHQSIAHEEVYWELCYKLKGLANTIHIEKPSYPSRKDKLFKTVARKQARATLESRL